MYPNAQHLESIPLPTYVNQYPASRVSSACSCLSITPSTSIFTASVSSQVHPPFAHQIPSEKLPLNSISQTSTSTVTTTSTLTGPCATQYPSYKGTYLFGSLTFPGPVTLPGSGYTAYDCCLQCFNGAPEVNCIAWASGNPGCCSIASETFPPGHAVCTPPTEDILATTDLTLFPNNVGGPGPCAGLITIGSAPGK